MLKICHDIYEEIHMDKHFVHWSHLCIISIVFRWPVCSLSYPKVLDLCQ